MIASPPRLRGLIRIKYRKKCDTPLDLRLPTRRKTVLDRQLTGDVWLENLGHSLMALCVDEKCLACINGVSLDLPSFNRLLERLWHRPPSPRRSVRTAD